MDQNSEFDEVPAIRTAAGIGLKENVKVAFVTIPDRGLRIGGARLQIEKTAEHLRQLGVEVRLYSPWEDSLEGVDVCHIFQAHWSVHPYCVTAKGRGIPVVISPIFNTASSPAWFLRNVVHYACRIPGVCVSHRLVEEMLQNADALLPLGESERKFLLGAIPGLDPSRLHVVPNGTEQRFADATPHAFVEKFGFAPDVVFVGRIDDNKNLLTVIRALRGTGLRIAAIGSGEGMFERYVEQCRREGEGSVTFVGRLPHGDPLLASAYAASKVFVLPSLSELFPVSAMEAGLAGCRIVITTNSAIGSALGDDAVYVNPRRSNDWRNAILREHKNERNTALSRRLLTQYTWPGIAGRIADVYNLAVSRGS